MLVPSPMPQRATALRSNWLSALVCCCVALLTACGDSDPNPRDNIPTPTVTGPVQSEGYASPTKNYTFYASDVPLASQGYVEEEFFLEGKANAYDTPVSTPATPPTTLAKVVTADVPYKTRMVVRRPVDPARFNGTVVIEWLNVTDGFDGEYFWVQSHSHLTRAGYAYIGVSAQDNGISNVNTGLKAFSPVRYGSLDVTGGGGECCTADKLSYDIFTQAAKAAYDVPEVLKGLAVRNAIGIGMSQSGSRFGVYANYVHELAPIYDALLIQVANPVLRDDLKLPVIKVLSESEASVNGLNASQPDTALRKTYWVAGTTHGDSTQRMGRTGVRLRDLGLARTGNDACGPGGATPTRNRTPFRHVLNAALEHLKRQVEQGVQPPSGPALRRASTAADAPLLRDAAGNAVGGIRLAHMEAPTARANGIECGNIGAWVPFTVEQLQALYPTHEAYVSKVRAAATASTTAGFVLPEDAAETIAEAEASVIGTGQQCGNLCLNRSHYRVDFSSTGLLRETTVYYDIRNGQSLVQAVDAAHRAVSAGDSTTGAARTQQYAQAATELRRFLTQLQAARAEGRVTSTAADILKMQADTIIAGLGQ
jgi:hypothetical protein